MSNARIEIGQRLQRERERIGLTQADLGARAGITRTSQFNYESGMRTPDAEYLQVVAEVGIDVLYVVNGVPGVLRLANEFVTIPMLGVLAAAGSGFVNEPAGNYRVEGMCFKRSWLQQRRLSPDNLAVITVRGESMRPVLADGDQVLLDLLDVQPRSGFVYVIRQADELLVKYCQMLPGGILRVKSANADYDPYEVDLSKTPDVQIVGRVVASMHEW